MKNLRKSLFTLLIMLLGICSPLQAGKKGKKKKKNKKSAFTPVTNTAESKTTEPTPTTESKEDFIVRGDRSAFTKYADESKEASSSTSQEAINKFCAEINIENLINKTIDKATFLTEYKDIAHGAKEKDKALKNLIGKYATDITKKTPALSFSRIEELKKFKEKQTLDFLKEQIQTKISFIENFKIDKSLMEHIFELTQDHTSLLTEHIRSALSPEQEIVDAVYNGNLKKTQRLLDLGCHADTRMTNNESQPTLLMIATAINNKEIINELIKRGADIFSMDTSGSIALHGACYDARIDIVKILLEQNTTQLNCVDEQDGDTPLHYAVAQGHLEVVKILLEHGADINIPNTHGMPALAQALFNEKFETNPKKYLDIANFLIEHDSTLLNWQDNEQDTLLTLVARSHTSRSNTELILWLLSKKNDDEFVNAKNNYGNSALSIAASAKNTDVVSLLCEHGADVNSTDEDAYTPLMHAVRANSENTVRRLLNYNADLTQESNYGQTALSLAQESGFKNIATIIETELSRESATKEFFDTEAKLAATTPKSSKKKKKQRPKSRSRSRAESIDPELAHLPDTFVGSPMSIASTTSGRRSSFMSEDRSPSVEIDAFGRVSITPRPESVTRISPEEGIREFTPVALRMSPTKMMEKNNLDGAIDHALEQHLEYNLPEDAEYVLKNEKTDDCGIRKLSYKLDGQKKVKTLFPKHWTKAIAAQQITDAFLSKKYKKPSTDKDRDIYYGKTLNELPIEFIVPKSDTNFFITAYPIFGATTKKTAPKIISSSLSSFVAKKSEKGFRKPKKKKHKKDKR